MRVCRMPAGWVMMSCPDACKSLLLVAEETGVDFVTGEVTRLFEASNTTGLWYPHLFTEKRVVNGIAEAPEYFFDHLSTNKLYRTSFIRDHALTFPEGIHDEDQLFSAQAFSLAESFAVVPWSVYTWRLAPESVSISSSRHKIQNVADRIGVARLIDTWFEENGRGELRAEKDYKFLRHDFRLYLGDLPFRDLEWTAEFADVVNPYLDEISDETYARLSREERVCIHLLRTGRLEELQVAARQLGRPQLAPRFATEEGEATYWGAVAPADDKSRSELDISEWYLREQVLATGRIRHELTSVTMLGPVLHLEIRTYDPAGLITEGTRASVKLAAHKTPLTVPLTLNPQGDGQYVSKAELDFRKVPVGKVGVATRRHPVVALERDGGRRTDILLAKHDQPDFRATVTYHKFGIHHLRIGAEQKGAGRLEVTWNRSGVLKSLEPLGPMARKAKGKVGKVRKILVGNEGKATAYDAVSKLPAPQAPPRGLRGAGGPLATRTARATSTRSSSAATSRSTWSGRTPATARPSRRTSPSSSAEASRTDARWPVPATGSTRTTCRTCTRSRRAPGTSRPGTARPSRRWASTCPRCAARRTSRRGASAPPSAAGTPSSAPAPSSSGPSSRPSRSRPT
ncbi:hypothetical protein STANM309S_02743 [Streptomyces tanashiensis]